MFQQDAYKPWQSKTELFRRLKERGIQDNTSTRFLWAVKV
jgi:hypothetical protein